MYNNKLLFYKNYFFYGIVENNISKQLPLEKKNKEKQQVKMYCEPGMISKRDLWIIRGYECVRVCGIRQEMLWVC